MGRPRSSSSSGSESRKSCNRGHWRPAEDERLRVLVKQFGPQNWNFISEHLEGRSGKSCRLRWYNQLDPNIIKKPFTDEEEEMLLALHKVKGNKWAAIARFFPGRTDNSVKNHFHVLMARRKRERLTLFGEAVGHNSRINNFNLQNYKNTGIFGMSSSQSSTPWTLISGSSTITTSFDASGGVASNKAHKDSSVSSSAGEKSSYGTSNHFPSYGTAAGSCILGSYHSFTAPGIPSVGKVVPLKFSNSNYGRRTEDSINIGKHPRDKSVTLCKLTMNIHQQEQPEPLKQKGVPFIDFLGVESSSANDHDSISGS